MTVDVAPVIRELPQPRIDAYAAASGDHNAIHVDAAFAAGTPFGGTIAHGMLVLSLIGEALHAAHGQDWLSSGKLKARFKAPARSGDSVTASVSLLKQEGARLEYAVQCATQAGDIVIEGRASVTAS